MFVIEKDIAIPSGMTGKLSGDAGRPRIYNWGEMDVGDSVLLASIPHASIARWMQKNPGQRFRTRKGEDGFRIWRIA